MNDRGESGYKFAVNPNKQNKMSYHDQFAVAHVDSQTKMRQALKAGRR